MKNFLTRHREFLKTSTSRLTLSYLAIIMLMSISFSFIFYNTSAHEVGKRVDIPPSITNTVQGERPNEGRNPELDAFFKQRAEAIRHELLIKLILINVLVLAGGSFLSYYLARKTLEPIEANIEAQAQFVSDASHELRTPLTALQTTNEVALRKPKGYSAEARGIFQQNVDDVIKLRRLTDSLLNLAKTENVQASTNPTELSDIVSDAMNSVLDSAIEKKISIEDNVSRMSILADRVSLSQAIVTILDNAIKYSPTKSHVSINAEQRGKYAILSIKDQGIGIKAVHLQHIFDRFYRIDDSRNKQRHDGFGIGLSFAKKVIEQHNGKIYAESTPDSGSTFIVKLPLSKP